MKQVIDLLTYIGIIAIVVEFLIRPRVDFIPDNNTMVIWYGRKKRNNIKIQL